MPGGSARGPGRAGPVPVKSTNHSEVAVADEQPAAVVVRRAGSAATKASTAAAAVAWRARARGRSPRERLVGVLGLAQGLVGQTGADPVLVDGEPGAARLLVAARRGCAGRRERGR